ncbi:leucine rich repeat protein [Ichthyophthirius multifiliis]|uniref:Leucine rich repeat protein n=1 Tax=Ichthyophthirius multifiliis TaxID=5932 RepID=G0QZK6_ICHMU|nr:leucine rich repeat protein [Ichthyophthirius multifiliis]EGR29347.1 leucine rich repeat protein [Ichthyophthirius multifiliis]|eukprot:XP_004030583.1 leucine rich repeat protein [Ichthyophthirius multifiliis]
MNNSKLSSIIEFPKVNVQSQSQINPQIQWNNKFRLLEIRKELKYTQNKAKNMINSLNHYLPPNRKGLSQAFQKIDNREKISEKEKIGDLKKEKEILQNMELSFEIIVEDNKHKSVTEENAQDNFYRHYQKLDKITQQNKFFQVQESAFTSILDQAQKLSILPCKIGLIKQKGNEEDLRINSMMYGDLYAKVLSEGLKRLSSVQNFYLQGNRITNKGSGDLLKTISRKAKILQLQQNSIGRIGCEHIAASLSEKEFKSRIEVLNLENNKLGDISVGLILDALQTNKSLKKMNLSKNYLTDKSGEKLASILQNEYLQELYLHWNQIKANGGALVFAALFSNEELKVLDFSCNSLGLGGSCVEQICAFLGKNIELKHLDLSNNYFNQEQSVKVAEALEKNQSIYGFHFSGNCGYVDSRGFLIVEDEKNYDLTGVHIKQRINGCKVLNQNYHTNQRDKDIQDCCWICQGWSEQEITWIQDKSGEGLPDPIFIHFNFENYRACYFGKQQGPEYIYKRMVPPFYLQYFFTLEESQNYDHSLEERITPNPEIGNKINNVLLFDNTLIDVDLQFINKINVKKSEQIIDCYYSPVISILPRTRDPKYILAAKKKKRIKWSFPISLMYKWKPDDEEIYKKCFEVDWENCKIPQKIKKQEDQDQVKEFLRSKYKHIKDTYKYFASQNPIQDIWCIQNTPWLELVSLMNVIDSKVKDADINLKWTATISGGEKGNPRNPERGISRHQLMEALVRISEEKYILKYQRCNTFIEAIKLFWEENLEQIFVEKYNSQKWRTERYWNEECDYCLKNYKKIIDYVYKKFAKQKVKPGQPPFMCLDELIRIVSLAGLTEDEHFGSTVCYFAFNLSMMTQIDELQSDRIFQMSQVEFYEALARIAEEASLPVGPGVYEENYEWTWEKRKEQILGYKIEGLILKIFDTVCDAGFKSQYPKITKSFFVKIDDSDEYEN